jgi:MoaA/NifB/PqqE/SkfB family radical SAM enzyme
MANISYIQVIRKCNQNCIFCSNPENLRELSLAEIKKIIDDFKKQGIKEIIFTGGEPTINKDIVEIIKYATANKIISRLITNGQKICDEEFLNKLIKAGLNKIHVSFYSYKPKIQNYLSQNKDSYTNLIKSLDNLRDKPLQVTINTVINKYNANDLDKNVLFLIKNYPFVNHFVFNNCDPYLNRASENKHVIPKLNDFKQSLNRALKILNLSKKTFRVEKVPLCFMLDFAEYSTETRKIVKEENRLIYFLDERELDDQKSGKFRYPKQKECTDCSLQNICAGLQGAVKYYDPKELIPQEIDEKIITNKILNGK